MLAIFGIDQRRILTLYSQIKNTEIKNIGKKEIVDYINTYYKSNLINLVKDNSKIFNVGYLGLDELKKINKQTAGTVDVVRKKMDAEIEKSKNAF